MDIVDKFLNQYLREIDFYEKAARICAETCEDELEREGIRAIVTYRVKRIDRLKDKLTKRNESHHYATVDEIYEDIVDLAGVRIATYFPNDINKIDKFIKTKFNVKKIKDFPQANNDTADTNSRKNEYKKVFSGYNARHYRVALKSRDKNDDGPSYNQAMIEIQVASVLMHAWSEVEHDLVYKPLNGEVSIDEYEILDELNGLILAGELSLKRLQKAVKQRVRKNGRYFSSHYELASFIYDRISSESEVRFEDISMGRVDVLFKFLKTLNMHKPEYIDKYIDKVDPDYNSISVVEQIIDMIIEGDSSLYKILLRVKSQMNGKNPYMNSDEKDNNAQSKRTIFYFIDKMADLQYVMRKYANKFHPELKSRYTMNMDMIINLIDDQAAKAKLESIKDINTEIRRGSSIPSDEMLIEGGKIMALITQKMLSNFDSEERNEIEERIQQIEVKVE